ncbi:MAG: substrate-binding domain-containing protein, partial [Actinomycetota bacterium]
AVRSGFPDRPLTLYGPGTDSGTFDYFTDEIVGEEGASRDDYTASENDNDLVTGVGGDQNALGYFGFAYYEQNRDKLKLVGVDGGDGCVKPSKETIRSGKYKPLSRPLFVYVSKKAAAKPEVSSFVDFYLESVNNIVADVGYVAMPDEALEKATADWEGFRG